MRLLILFVLTIALAEAMGSWGKWKKRVKLSTRAIKGKPFMVRMTEPKPSSLKAKLGWLSRLKNRKPVAKQPKTKELGTKKRSWRNVFGKEMREEPTVQFEGSAMAPLNESLINETDIEGSGYIHDDIESRVRTENSHSHGRDYRYSLMNLQISGKTYPMLLDTASPYGMIPQAGATVTPAGGFGSSGPLWDPPANEDTSTLTPIGTGFGHGRWKGFMRSGTMTVAGMNIPAQFVAANEIHSISFPIMSASAHVNRLNLAYQILLYTQEPKKQFTTVFLPPTSANPGAANGLVVFGGTDSTRCMPEVYWMPEGSSAGVTNHDGWNLQFRRVSAGIVGNEVTVGNFDQTAKVDSGCPHLRVQSGLFGILMNGIEQATGVKPTVAANGYPSVPCSIQMFFIGFEIRDAVSGKTKTIRIWKRDLLIARDAQGNCSLLIMNGGTAYNLFGFPLYRSACITHDYDGKRVGISMVVRGAKLQ